jgi:pyrimidine operon attenuation protein/uracil phosphoribosyltransferase
MSTNLPFDVDGARIVLVDDVLDTGRTVRAALNELFDYGRPQKVDLAVLADRHRRELPVDATFKGAKVDLGVNQILVLEQLPDSRFEFTTESKKVS